MDTVSIRMTETHEIGELNSVYPYISGKTYDVSQQMRDYLVHEKKVAVEIDCEEKLAAPVENKLKDEGENKHLSRKQKKRQAS